ncbi:MAG: hypothetical protein NTU51_06010 [Bacteroidetes bacterium]|nr:hypothetical protein [Bacteroidota bacterium]
MRTIALLTIMTLSFLGNAQDYTWFICKTEKEIRNLSDSIALNAKRDFKFDTMQFSHLETTAFIVTYSDTKDTIEHTKLNVAFVKYMKGENKDLEIPGVPEYRFTSVRGRYLDLFPFWQKFINPKANMQNISEKKFDEIKISLPEKKFMTFRFSVTQDLWRIRMIQY